MKRLVTIFTGNRAEFGLLAPIIHSIGRHPDLSYSLLVSGAHLDNKFGSTLEEIRKEGLRVGAEIHIDYPLTDGPVATPVAIGSAVTNIARVLEKMKPNIMLVYADRFETLGATIASSQMGIITAHIEGGDLTEGGAFDDSVRHAMTKLSHYHFTTNTEAKNRILKMGEEPWRVKTIGLPTVQTIRTGNFATPSECVEALQLSLDQPILVFTQHPVATEFAEAGAQILNSLLALKELGNRGVQVVVTYPNNDLGSEQIIAELERIESTDKIRVYKSLGRYLYQGLLALGYDKAVRICVAGNSSSGIKETPFFSCPTVNIGSRQKGRLRAGNVIDVPQDQAMIVKAIETSLFDDSFRTSLKSLNNPYDAGADPGELVAHHLATLPLGKEALQKKMTY
jgi:UDP-N-acetylglucosamine 2-epimerase (non-hydrolysing)/GDP/UDP-N,N'-diacetylbacillosamine 2-epimerase (hydrolysing)